MSRNKIVGKCNDHPDYKALQQPSIECLRCWTLWYAQLMKQGKPTYVTGRDLGDETGS